MVAESQIMLFTTGMQNPDCDNEYTNNKCCTDIMCQLLNLFT